MYLAQSAFSRWARQSILRLFHTDPITIEFDPRLQLPIVNYGVRRGVIIGKQVNPLTVALYACKHLRLESIIGPIPVRPLRATETPEYVARAVQWLLSNEKRRKHFSVWQYDFRWPDYDLKPPWRSALMEAYGALLLLACKKRYEARRHLESILTDYRQTGVSYINGDALFPLEYVSDERVLVLNGILRCLLILRECSIRLNDALLKDTFERAYASLKPQLNSFDAGCYTFYDSRGTPADRKYHELHVELLRLMMERTGDHDLVPILARWTRYSRTYSVIEPIAFMQHIMKSKGHL
jgi:hypothetical protein